MKVLYVTGSCLTRNTSANMSHNAFVQGLLENGCDLDIVMARESWGQPDQALPMWEGARYFTFSSVSFSDRLRYRLRGGPAAPGVAGSGAGQSTRQAGRRSLKAAVRSAGKKLFYTAFPADPVYPLEKEWLKNAVQFCGTGHYDLVISNSSPAASHKLVALLRDRSRITFDRWIQIWEDPWYHDLYGGHSSEIEREEHWLLQQASVVAYVSPLTLLYQKRFYPDCADKMTCVPLPALQLAVKEDRPSEKPVSFGYFGDYFSQTRDLLPFYDALKESGLTGYIYGDSNIDLPSTERITVSPRVTLDKLAQVQAKTGVLVHLSNLKGGQIPGKIYHYSVTDKPILFILDGTEEEQEALLDFFGRYERYTFCRNDREELLSAIGGMAENRGSYPAVEAFTPKEVVRQLLTGEGGQ